MSKQLSIIAINKMSFVAFGFYVLYFVNCQYE